MPTQVPLTLKGPPLIGPRDVRNIQQRVRFRLTLISTLNSLSAACRDAFFLFQKYGLLACKHSINMMGSNDSSHAN